MRDWAITGVALGLSVAFLIVLARIADRASEPNAAREAEKPELTVTDSVRVVAIDVQVRGVDSDGGHAQATALAPLTPAAAPSGRFQYAPDLVTKGTNLLTTQLVINVDDSSIGGFEGYVALMTRLGGRAFVVDRSSRRVLAEVEPVSGKIVSRSGDVGSLAGAAPREVRGREAQEVLGRACTQLDLPPARAALAFLLPENVEAYVRGALQRALEGEGSTISRFSRFEGSYESAGGTASLRITRGRMKGGEDSAMDVLVVLPNASHSAVRAAAP